MFIRTPRLFLRPAFPEDWRELLAGIGEEPIVRNLARAPWPYGEEDARQFCERPFDACAPSFLVTLPDEPGAPVIGGCGFGAREQGEDLELGYWIARDRWGCGYATEAVGGLLAIARMLGLPQLEAGHFLDNPASGRVLTKSGFAPTGEIVRHVSVARGDAAPCARYLIDLDRTTAISATSMPAAA